MQCINHELHLVVKILLQSTTTSLLEAATAGLQSVHCTVYSVQCTVYSLQCTVYSVQCTVYSVQCAMILGLKTFRTYSQHLKVFFFMIFYPVDIIPTLSCSEHYLSRCTQTLSKKDKWGTKRKSLWKFHKDSEISCRRNCCSLSSCTKVEQPKEALVAI